MGDVMFLSIFTCEIAMKICWMKCRPYFRDFWNKLDLFLTVMMAIQLFAELTDDPNVPGHVNHLGDLAKLARILRFIRILRVLKAQPELVIVVDGLVKSGKPLFWIIITLIVITYIFAVFFVVSVKHDIFADSNVDPKATLCEKDEFFCDLQRAMQTLLDIIVGAEWSNVSHPITQHQPWLLLPLNIFLVVTVFGIANVIVGVIVDATAETKIRLKFKENREKLIQVSKMWEEEIVQAGFRLEALHGLEGDALEAKQKQRQEKTEEIVKRIIDSKCHPQPSLSQTKW